MNGPAADLARHLVVGLAGPQLHPAERAWLVRRRPAGVILFARNVTDPPQLESLCRELHALVPGLEIVADHEGGPISVLAAAAGRPPAAATLGLLDDPDLTRRVHAATARGLVACGLDRVLAPVADVLTEPRNPVIGVRAFGRDAALVARHVGAAVSGLREGGLAVCLKHWPGHGGTTADSHLGAAVAAGAESAAPFAAGLEAGADAVMVAHVQQTGAGLPASLDPATAAAARALAGGGTLDLYADDITMGALRIPLAARGVAVPAGEGLIEPAQLTAAWCAALLDGGCDRLLVRGIPWGAFPDDEPGPPLPASVPPAVGAATSQPAWDEAHRLLARRLPDRWLAGPGRLVWLDRTAGDRWGPLAGGEGPVGLPPALAAACAGPGAAGQAAGAGRLLITSHRPLERAQEASWAARTAARGIAVAVGHPALEADLEALLPPGWLVAWLPEFPRLGDAQIV